MPQTLISEGAQRAFFGMAGRVYLVKIIDYQVFGKVIDFR
jgi:hypothetical protein